MMDPRSESADERQREIDLGVALRFGFRFEDGAKHPLVKKSVHREKPPFPQIDSAIRHPDILVFFAEGVSTRLLNEYGSEYPHLTPNLDRFALQALRFDNYFSHTAATYRGLHGQLCSLFPTHSGRGAWPDALKGGGFSTRFLCLHDVLRESGYESEFIDADRLGRSVIRQMMRALGFDDVW